MKKLLTEWRKFLKEFVITREMDAIAKAFVSSPSHAMYLLDALGDEEVERVTDLRRIMNQIKRFDTAIEEVLSGNTSSRAINNVVYAVNGAQKYMREAGDGMIFKRDDIENFIEPLKFLEDQVVRRKFTRGTIDNSIKADSDEARGYLHLKDIVRGL